MSLFVSGKYAAGICDRCGLRYRYRDLSEQLTDGRRTGLVVCRACNDVDNEQDYVGQYLTVDAEALECARPPNDLRSRTFCGFKPVVGLEIWSKVGRVTISGGV